jgi:HEAT repeat protein
MPLRATFGIAVLIIVFFLPNAFGTKAELLVQRLKATASPEIGITKKEQALAKELQGIGAEAIPLLLPLLADENEAIRQLASYTLRDMDGLTEEHLDALIAACRRGEGWIPPAIARVGTPRAVNFLVEELVRQRKTQNQLTWAIEILGEKAVPALVQIYQRETDWDEELEQTMQSVMGSLGMKAAAAVDPLLAIVLDDTQPAAKRRRAIVALGSIGEPEAIRRLQQRKDYWELRGDSTLTRSVEEALVKVGVSEAVPILTRELKESADPFRTTLIMRDLARLSERGVSAGPAVIEYLNNADWDLRVAAARTLGFIGYQASASTLIPLLKCKEDWRLVLCTAESLGRLQNEEALRSLEDVSKGYWYPPVRDAARGAIAAIRRLDSQKDNSTEALSKIDTFFDYKLMDEKVASLDEKEEQLLRLPVAVKPAQRLAVDNGHFIATDNGEWGGETKFIDSNGVSHLVVKENTQAVYRTPDGALAVTGLAHMDFNAGAIYRLIRKPDGSWSGEKWRVLPGAPRFSRMLEGRNLFVSCYGGIVAISREGEIRLLTRSESLRSPKR